MLIVNLAPIFFLISEFCRSMRLDIGDKNLPKQMSNLEIHLYTVPHTF